MSFREKSAWIMGAIMLVTGLFYADLIAGAPAAPMAGPLIPFVLAVTVLSIIGQAIIGIAWPREANTPADEREAIAIDRAGHWSGNLLGLGVIGAIAFFAMGHQGNLVMHGLVLALIVASLVEYALQIWFFRRGAV